METALLPRPPTGRRHATGCLEQRNNLMERGNRGKAASHITFGEGVARNYLVLQVARPSGVGNAYDPY
jgi:hypothetical protein